MDRHLLVTVSEQVSALCGVRFVGNFFARKDDVRITLFYTAPKPASIWENERTHEKTEWAKKQAQEYEVKGREILESAKKKLCSMGFQDDRIDMKLKSRQQSKVMDIVYESVEGRYDAVVLGRRGLTWFEELLSESTSKRILETRVNFPIWFCRKPREGCNDVLVCMDGSDAAFRMVDHVSFILAPENNREITVFSVNKKDALSATSLEAIRSRTLEMVADNGFPADRVRFKVLEASNVPRTILREAGHGSYGAVAVGRSRSKPGFYLGSVSTTLFRDLEGAALWITY